MQGATPFIRYLTMRMDFNYLIKLFINFPAEEVNMESVNLLKKFSKISDYWHPYIVGELNDNYIKLAIVKGEFVWHQHDDEDELFVVQKGTLYIDFKDKTVEVKTGEILTVPRGVEHRPHTNGEEVFLMLIEPKNTKHTGELKTEMTVEQLEWI